MENILGKGMKTSIHIHAINTGQTKLKCRDRMQGETYLNDMVLFPGDSTSHSQRVFGG